ncbi:hypothetical protein MKW98_031101 [Papaver atlanticum]|uniref:Uncharacterized protein n=1 Tax=Papaver atlanticum TaxID=357466 RepID=A0AAD4XLT3_9MAGN|nr:hypothetical protein MKW98_031101 [Papaver atlanticum]
MDSSTADEEDSDVLVSPFDYSTENHFRAMDKISELCGEKPLCVNAPEESSVTFVRQWKDFRYVPRTIKFVRETESQQGKYVSNDVNLPQFSSASVPKMEQVPIDANSSKPRKDFVLYVGGHVWALDWCPRVHQKSDCDIKCEYLAVSAHPPESSYHKIGATLTGRGVIQIWCVLNVSGKEEDLPPLTKKKGKQGRPRKQIVTEESSSLVKKPRGRPRKTTITKPLKKAKGRPRKTPIIEDLTLSEDSDEVFLDSQTDEETDQASPPLRNRRGRQKKEAVMEESVVGVDGDSQITQALANHTENPTEERAPPLKVYQRTKWRTDKKPVSKESVKNLDRNNQIPGALTVQIEKGTDITSLPLNKTKITSSPLNKTKRKLRKKKVTEDSIGNLDSSSMLSLALVPSDKGTDRTSPPSTRIKLRSRRTKSRTSNNLARENKSALTSDDELLDEHPGILTNVGAKMHNDREAELKFAETDIELQKEAQEDCDLLINTFRKKRKRKEKGKDEISIEGIRSTETAKLTEGQANESPLPVLPASVDCGQHSTALNQIEVTDGCLDSNKPDFQLPKDVLLPRLVLCLAHNGKVAWDVKWRPLNVDFESSEDMHRMGYLAVLLGNGSLEVWEVPSPSKIKALYASYQEDSTDPRFMKLAPVFKCLELKTGDRQSIPLTLEWSRASPHDLIVAGCHDGTVALWKFSPTGSPQDSKPLLCFSADNAPIRSLAWAPCGSDAESVNVIATAGHGGLRFWDLRDPYRPLWDLNPMRRTIYSVDWLPDPRCVIMSFDDGTLRILSLLKSANDVSVTGKPYAGTQQQGLHSFFCSSFPVWSVQASRLTGIVAYCSADGYVVHFQLTEKAVDKDPSRNKAPHFLCGSLTDEDAAVAVNTPLPGLPFPLKKSLNEWGDTPRSTRGVSSDFNHAKKAKDQPTSDDTRLVLREAEYTSNCACELLVDSQKGKSISKTKASKKKTSAADQALAISEEAAENSDGGEENQKEEKQMEIDVFPSKIVALHKVRWNMNKGSGRWLCYGGAAGIVRCQEISTRFL